MFLFLEAFPDELKDDVQCAANRIPKKTFLDVRDGISISSISYTLNGKQISFPERLYFIEPPEFYLWGLTQRQKNILHCIYSRSCDGYMRERHVKALLEGDVPEFAVPFIVKVCDEYVVEILDLVYSMLCNKDTTVFKDFCLENRRKFCQSHARMVSYWNEYYRNRYRYDAYTGEKLFSECFGYSRSLEREI